MEESHNDPAHEIRRLERSINDLVGVLALSSLWSSGPPSSILSTFLDALLTMLNLEFVYARVKDPAEENPIETLRLARSSQYEDNIIEICEMLRQCFGDDPLEWPSHQPVQFKNGTIHTVPMQLGLQGEIGLILAGAKRADFPEQTERLVLNVAANQAAIGLHHVWLLNEQKRIAVDLDRHVGQRTAQLAQANEVLRREISERQEVEHRLREEERALRRSKAFLAEGQRLSRTGSFSWCAKTGEITCSDGLYRVFDFPHGAPLTLDLMAERVLGDDMHLVNNMIDQMSAGTKDIECEFRLQLPDQSVKHLHLIARGTHNTGGKPEYVGAVQDITQRRMSEEVLRKAQSELANVARITSLGILTASIAHEVNQPLSGIVTNASTCLRMLASDPPNIDGARETVRRTIRDGNRASEVITRLRALFTNKSTTNDLVDLNDAAREVIAVLLSELQRKRVIFRQELADNLPLVRGDRVQLQQVILNLLRNALDALSVTEDRPRQVLIKTGREREDRVFLTVRDSGIGFDSKAAERLFEAFHTTKKDGMGIGLSVSRSIIESHHGRIWAALNDGPGAKFTFSIPCADTGVTRTE